MLLKVNIQPKAKKDQIAGWLGDELKVRVTAPPVDGAANEALLRFLAKSLGLKKNMCRLKAGTGSRHKLVELDAPEEMVKKMLEKR